MMHAARHVKQHRLQELKQRGLARPDRDAALRAPETKVTDVSVAVVKMEIDSINRPVDPQELVEK